MPVPFQAWFEATVSALVYSLCYQHTPPELPRLKAPYNDIALFVLNQWRELPDYLRLPMKGATLALDSLALSRARKRFHQCPPSLRAKLLETAKSSSGFQRDLVRYYDSLVTLALYSRTTDVRAGPTPVPAFHGSQGFLQNPSHQLLCEIAVIGSGPGGAITACLLAEAGRDVLLIEEGPCLGLDSCVPFSKQEMEQKYRNRGQTAALGRNKIAYAEGRCVGGGSEINSGLYHRTPPEILERWRTDFTVSDLTESDLKEHFEAIERDLSISLLPGQAPTASLKLDLGARKLGWKSMEVPRWFRYSPGDTTPTQGVRQSMTQTYVPRFIASGGRLLPNTRINRLRQEGAAWMLDGRHADSGRLTISAETVFICGGAIQTPALLRRSGITNNVGNSLRLHPTIKVLARFPEEVNSPQMGVPVHQVKQFAPHLSFGCSISSLPFLALGLLDYPAELQLVASQWPHMANYYAMLAGESTGTIRTVPGYRDPLVRYRLNHEDGRLLANGLRNLCTLLFQAGADRLFPSLSGQTPLNGPQDIPRLPDDLANGLASLMTIHLFSSCPMGENPTICPANSFGRVRECKKLFVNDASLLCGPPGVNPQGTIMALARRNTLRYLSGQ